MSLHEVSGATAKAGPSLPAWRLPMIEILSAPAHVAAFRLSGTVTADDYDKVIATIEAKLAAGGSIGVYVDALGFEDMTADAIGKDLRYGLGKLGDLDRFGRSGIVPDKQWLRSDEHTSELQSPMRISYAVFFLQK